MFVLTFPMLFLILYHESFVRVAVSVLKTFVGPDVLEEWELVRSVRDSSVIERGQRGLQSIHDNSVHKEQSIGIEVLQGHCKRAVAKWL